MVRGGAVRYSGDGEAPTCATRIASSAWTIAAAWLGSVVGVSLSTGPPHQFSPVSASSAILAKTNSYSGSADVSAHVEMRMPLAEPPPPCKQRIFFGFVAVVD